MKSDIEIIYDVLNKYYGDLKWWPGETVFEVIAGAILTQNTSWGNVEKAIKELERNKMLTPDAILKSSNAKLASVIRSSGYHRVKAGRLRNISKFIMLITGGKGDLRKVSKYNTSTLRKKLLDVNGVGPETADSILLYAFNRPIFVVDAYTKRIFSRHGIIPENISYNDLQELAHKNFPSKVKKLNQFHAVLVETAKRFCKKNSPLCDKCPLNKIAHKI